MMVNLEEAEACHLCTCKNDLQAGALIIEKTVVNDNGGDAVVADFGISTDAVGTLNFTPDSGTSTIVYTSQTITVDANHAYSLSESDVTGYSEGSWSCDGNNGGGGAFDAGTVTLDPGETVTCKITNDDQAPGLIIEKTVVNDNGGDAVVADFGISTDAVGTLNFTPDSGTSTIVYTSQTITVDANQAYSLSESDVTGYSEGSWSCDGNNGGGGAFDAGTVTLDPGETVTCKITNDDQAPGLIIEKTVVNDNGGDAVVADFGISTDAVGTLNFTPDSGTSTIVYTSQTITVDANHAYSLSESDVTGYSEGSWSCDGNNGGGGAFDAGTVTLDPGETVTCKITNDDQAPGLIIEKTVVNDNGGDAVVADFGISTDAVGTLNFTPDSGTSTIVYTSQTITVDANQGLLAQRVRRDRLQRGQLVLRRQQRWWRRLRRRHGHARPGRDRHLHHHQRRHRAQVDPDQGRPERRRRPGQAR